MLPGALPRKGSPPVYTFCISNLLARGKRGKTEIDASCNSNPKGYARHIHLGGQDRPNPTHTYPGNGYIGAYRKRDKEIENKGSKCL